MRGALVHHRLQKWYIPASCSTIENVDHDDNLHHDNDDTEDEDKDDR